MHSSNWLFS